MAEKEACVYIVELGQHMAAKGQGRNQTDLEWALDYVWDRLSSTISTDRKTLLAGILGLGSDETSNPMGDEEGFKNISTLLDIQQPLLSHVERLRRRFVINDTYAGDAISAIAIAVHLIIAHCKKLKYIRKIVLITSGQGPMFTGDIGQIISKINEHQIQLTVLGIDFDDPEYGFKEENKSPEKQEHETILRNMVSRCNGVYGSLVEAIEEMQMPRIKMPRSVATFKGLLTLGNPEGYDTAIKIDVERYMKISVQKAPTASSWVAKPDDASNQNSLGSTVTLGRSEEPMDIDQPSAELARVRAVRDYRIPDESTPGGEKAVERDSLAKGYLFGRTVVPISEAEENITTLETAAGMDIIGFIPKESHEPWFGMSTSYTILPMKGNRKAALALSSFIRALYELDTYAVARFVEKMDKPPTIRLLAPVVRADYECLIDVMLPFTEDVRPYRFPPLDRVLTINGEELTEHRNLPTRELQGAMDDFVDIMDLSGADQDEEGKPSEYARIDDTFSPLLHRINQALKYRAVHPGDPLPTPYPILTKYANPPPEILKAATEKLTLVKTIADVKRVPPKKKGRRNGRHDIKPMSGLDIEGLLSGARTSTISDDNPIPEFKRLLDAADSIEKIRAATKQMGEVIHRRIKSSFADKNYARAAEELRAYRLEMIALEEPDVFDEYIRSLKKKLLGSELGGDRKDMWYMLRGQKLGLISKRQCEVSKIEEEEANRFLWGRGCSNLGATLRCGMQVLYTLEIHDLNNIPLVSGTCYVKWYLPHSISAEHRGRTPASPIRDHLVTWDYKRDLSTRMTIDRQRLLETCEIRFDIVQEYYSGAKGERIDLGWVKLNLAEYVSELADAHTTTSPVQASFSKEDGPKFAQGAQASGDGAKHPAQPVITRRYLMRDSKINSTLKLSLGIHQLSGDRNFIAPPLRTAPVFGGIAGFMAASADPSSTSVHNLKDDEEGSRGREGTTGKHGPPLKDRVEIQDLYRSSLVARWAAMPNELAPEEVIEDIFNGGNGWPTDSEAKDKQDPEPEASMPGSSTVHNDRRSTERHRLLRKQRSGERVGHYRPFQKRTSTSPVSTRSFFGLHRHHTQQGSSHSQDSLAHESRSDGHYSSGLRPEHAVRHTSGPKERPEHKPGKHALGHKRSLSNEGLTGSSDLVVQAGMETSENASSKWVDEFEARDDLRSWTIAGYG